MANRYRTRSGHANGGRVRDADGPRVSFVHDAPELDNLLCIVACETRIAPGLVEKDYWGTHTLWALHHAGIDVWFKGGTSLSKGFGLIERFSEDLDLKLMPGSVSSLPLVSSWKSAGVRCDLISVVHDSLAAAKQQAFTLTGFERAEGVEYAQSRPVSARN